MRRIGCTVRLFVGEDEYFHKSYVTMVAISAATRITYNVRPLLGHSNGLADARKEWLEARERSRAAASSFRPPSTTTEAVANSNSDPEADS
jgi:hypothetical protein